MAVSAVRSRWQRVFRERMTAASVAVRSASLHSTRSQLSGIPRTRRRMHMGHAAKEVTDLYERFEARTYLVEGGKKLWTSIRIDSADSLPVSSPVDRRDGASATSSWS